MKRCLLVSTDYAPNLGGVAAYWSRVTADMPQGEWRVLTSASGRAEKQGGVVRMPLLSYWFWPRWLLGAYRMHQTMKQESCDLIVAAQVLPVGSMAYLLHRLFGVSYVVQVYGMDLVAAKQSSRKQRLAMRVLQQAQHCIANSHYTAQHLVDFGVTADKITVVYPVPQAPQAQPVQVAKLRTLHDLTNKQVVLTVGRLVTRKGQDTVIRAMEHVAKRIPNAVYVIVGDGPEMNRLRTLAAETGVPVVFTGAVSKDERDAWFALCDVFAMPTRDVPGDTEGFGMVYLEAGACSKPVIAAAVGGVAEAVQAGKTGLLVDPQSPQSVADAITRLLTDETLRERLGHGGRSAFEQEWSWPKQMEKLKNVLL